MNHFRRLHIHSSSARRPIRSANSMMNFSHSSCMDQSPAVGDDLEGAVGAPPNRSALQSFSRAVSSCGFSAPPKGVGLTDTLSLTPSAHRVYPPLAAVNPAAGIGLPESEADTAVERFFCVRSMATRYGWLCGGSFGSAGPLTGKTNSVQPSTILDWSRVRWMLKNIQRTLAMRNYAQGAPAPSVSDSVVPFQFASSHTVRVVLIDGEPWFVAADVAAALQYRIAGDMTRVLDDDDRGTHIVRTPSGDRAMLVVNESGLYSAILRSRKPEAKRFKKWVTADVLPAIRRTGRYQAPAAPQPPTISRAQFHELSRTVSRIAYRFHQSSAAEWAIWRVLRERFRIAQTMRLLACHYDEAIALLGRIEVRADVFHSAIAEAERELFRGDFEGLAHSVPATADNSAGVRRGKKRAEVSRV